MSTYPCCFCGKLANRRVPCTPPEPGVELYRWFCSVICEASWGTNQPRPEPPPQKDMFA